MLAVGLAGFRAFQLDRLAGRKLPRRDEMRSVKLGFCILRGIGCARAEPACSRVSSDLRVAKRRGVVAGGEPGI